MIGVSKALQLGLDDRQGPPAENFNLKTENCTSKLYFNE